MNNTYFSHDPWINIWAAISFILFAFLMFLFVTAVIGMFKRSTNVNKDFEPKISVVIPAYNEEKNIRGCVEHVLEADYPQNKLEIMVVDDGSTDTTAAIVNEIAQKHGHVSVVAGKHAGKSEAMNTGLQKARNEYILTIDADVEIAQNTIRELIAPFSDQKVAASNSVAVIRKPKKMIEYFQLIEFSLNNLIRTSFSKVFGNSIWFFGAVAIYRRSALEKVGYFKTDTLTEDMDICLELYNKGFHIITCPKAVITTTACPSVKELFKQRMRWYYGALQSLFKNKQLLHNKQRSPPIYFLFINQYWWTFFAFAFFPFTIYSVFFWLPPGNPLEIASYLFRWFSIVGPFYVLYKIPEWGLSLLNIFGVSSGIITLFMTLYAVKKFKAVVAFKTILGFIFYFPYTIIINTILISGVFYYHFRKKAYFIR